MHVKRTGQLVSIAVDARVFDLTRERSRHMSILHICTTLCSSNYLNMVLLGYIRLNEFKFMFVEKIWALVQKGKYS